MYIYNIYLAHTRIQLPKEAIAPLYMMGQHHRHTICISMFPWQYEVNPESVIMNRYLHVPYNMGVLGKLDYGKVITLCCSICVSQ